MPALRRTWMHGSRKIPEFQNLKFAKARGFRNHGLFLIYERVVNNFQVFKGTQLICGSYFEPVLQPFRLRSAFERFSRQTRSASGTAK